MTETTPTRAEVQARRKAIAESSAHYRREFNRGAATVATCLEYLQAECQHPETISEYQLSHFDRRCTDCGKLLD
jgi:hypothetical protein